MSMFIRVIAITKIMVGFSIIYCVQSKNTSFGLYLNHWAGIKMKIKFNSFSILIKSVTRNLNVLMTKNDKLI